MLLVDWFPSALSLTLAVGDSGKLQWTGNWVTFLDTMLQMIVVGLSGRSLRLPTRIRSVCVDPTVHQERVTEYGEAKKGIEIKHVHRPTTNTHLTHLRMPNAFRYTRINIC